TRELLDVLNAHEHWRNVLHAFTDIARLPREHTPTARTTIRLNDATVADSRRKPDTCSDSRRATHCAVVVHTPTLNASVTVQNTQVVLVSRKALNALGDQDRARAEVGRARTKLLILIVAPAIQVAFRRPCAGVAADNTELNDRAQAGYEHGLRSSAVPGDI